MAAGRVVFDGPPAALTDAMTHELYGMEADVVVDPMSPPLSSAPGDQLAAA